MKKVLSLDISSSTIGWSSFVYNDEEFTLINYGWIKPPKKTKGSVSYRLNETMTLIKELVDQVKPDEVAVEDYAKRFSSGKSRANTIIVLANFNEACCLACYQEMKKDVYRYPVMTIRSQVGKLLGQKIVSKDEVFPAIEKNAVVFKRTLNRNNNLKKECLDAVDAIAVGITHILKEGCSAKRYHI